MRRLAAVLVLLIAAHAATAAGDADELWRVYAQKSGSYAVKSRHLEADGRPRFINALIRESSPYLQQHAHNPVAWHAWGDAALATARKTNRLIFLSIGYSTCHWCHVMARESFDSERIAALLNGAYVSIKVDREERPDLDEFFLARLELLSNSPGWPMTLILTPEGDLFAADSYMTEDGLATLLTRMAKAWAERPEQVRRLAASVASKFSALPATRSRAPDTNRWYEGATQALRREYDEVNQGFGRAPKFPNAPYLTILLDAYSRERDPADRDKFVATLRTIAQSALNDQLDGGLFRYSQTSDWQTPHFEKMLVDQALLARLFAEAWGLTGEKMFAAASARTIDFVNNKLRRSDGLFFSAIDAESDGRPGAYYLWRETDLAALPPSDRALLAKNFQSVPQPDSDVLLLPRPSVAGAASAAVDGMLAKLAALRKLKTMPFVDQKVITGWNAMMIETLARVGDLLSHAGYAGQARSAMRDLLELHVRDAGIARYSVEKQVHGSATLEDVAHLLGALAGLYEADRDAQWHDQARRLLPRVVGTPTGAADQLRLFARDRELPAATAVLMRALHRLFLQSNDGKFRAALEAIAPVAANILAGDGVASRASLAAALYEIGHPLPQRGAFLALGHIRAELALTGTPGIGTKTGFDLKLRIDPGWHINSHRPVQDYLIPVEVSAVAAAERKKLSVTYPAGKLVRLGIDKSPLSVYEGSATISGRLETKPDAPLFLTPLTLKLQACTDKECLPPESVLLRFR